jgi:hypothetical protein
MPKPFIQPKPKQEKLKGINAKVPESLAAKFEVYASKEYTGMSKSEVITQLLEMCFEADEAFTTLMKQRASKQSTTTVPEHTTATQKRATAA